jgi:fucose 4-O-acetylase-like acetyltransferase
VQNRVDFIDWLKAIGMSLIVFGHYFGEPFDQFTQPVYPKQLGVAFFVFLMGWGLASETRPKWQVVYNRLFPMYFWGVAIALFISIIFMLTKGHSAITNYLPFFAGINVFSNFFPSNPTTWYIGT